MTYLSFFVAGNPAPQGSKRHVGNGVMVESSKAVKPWRQDVAAAARQAIASVGHEPYSGPVCVSVDFYFTRPKAHFGTGRNADRLKDTAPEWVVRNPDVDKLLRSTFDALTVAGIWRDDNLAAQVFAGKRYGDQAGALIHLSPITEGPRT
jgi:Holliday junction resolvase RusA-like endonuclease